jgi:hypothetical protein
VRLEKPDPHEYGDVLGTNIRSMLGNLTLCLSLCHCGARRGCCRTPDTMPCSRRRHAT